MTDQRNESQHPARKCQWCGGDFHSKHTARLYCSPACKTEFNNHMTVVGKRIAAEAMAWRRARGGKANGGADALHRLCALLDEANAQFVQARPKGAPSINDYIAARNSATGMRPFGKDR
jgi:hypothetical protein